MNGTLSFFETLYLPDFLVSTLVRTGFLPLVPSSIRVDVGDLLSALVERVVPAGVPFCSLVGDFLLAADWAVARVVRTGDRPLPAVEPTALPGETRAGEARLMPRSVTFLLCNIDCTNLSISLIILVVLCSVIKTFSIFNYN